MTNLSLIIPIRNQANYLENFLDKLENFLGHSRKNTYEVIFIDDGSKDETFSLLKSASSKDSRIRIVRLAKNYGLEAALRAGLMYITGECGLLMVKDFDSSLRLLPKMVDAWQQGEHIVISLTDPVNPDRSVKRILHDSIHDRTRDLSRIGSCLIDRSIIDSLVQFSSMPISWIDLIFSSGLSPFYLRYKPNEQDQMVFERRWYDSGSTRLLSSTPFISISFLGLVVMVFTMLFAIISGAYHWDFLPEFSRILVEVALFAIGMSACIVGGIGYLLYKAAFELNLKPFYVIDSLINTQIGSAQPKDKIDQLLINLSSSRRRKSTATVKINHEFDATIKSD